MPSVVLGMIVFGLGFGLGKKWSSSIALIQSPLFFVIVNICFCIWYWVSVSVLAEKWSSLPLIKSPLPALKGDLALHTRIKTRSYYQPFHCYPILSTLALLSIINYQQTHTCCCTTLSSIQYPPFRSPLNFVFVASLCWRKKCIRSLEERSYLAFSNLNQTCCVQTNAAPWKQVEFLVCEVAK